MKNTLKDTKSTLDTISANLKQLNGALRTIDPLISDDGVRYIIENVRIDIFGASTKIESICKNIDGALSEQEVPNE